MRKWQIKALAILFWLVVWQITAMLIGKEIVLPSVLSVLRALIALLCKGSFYAEVGTSVIRIVGGFCIGAVIGAFFAALSFISKTADALTSPLTAVMKATPVASIIIILLIWINRNYVPTVATLLVIVPLVAQNVLTGLRQTNAELIEMADAFKMSKANKIKYLFIPSALPYFSSASAVGIGMAWKAGVAAEVICNPTYGIGSSLYESKIYLETPMMFAWTATVVAVSGLFEWLLKLLIRYGKRRQGDDKA